MITFLIITSIILYLAGAYNWYQMAMMLGLDEDRDIQGMILLCLAAMFWFLLAIFSFFMNTSYDVVQYFKKRK